MEERKQIYHVKEHKDILVGILVTKGLLDDDTRVFLIEEVEKMSFLIFMDTKHHVYNLVVVWLIICRILSLHELGYWTWKAQITSIFIHEFMGHHDLLFQARYFDQILVSLHDVGILEQSTLSFMCLLHPIPRHHFKDDNCPMYICSSTSSWFIWCHIGWMLWLHMS